MARGPSLMAWRRMMAWHTAAPGRCRSPWRRTGSLSSACADTCVRTNVSRPAGGARDLQQRTRGGWPARSAGRLAHVHAPVAGRDGTGGTSPNGGEKAWHDDSTVPFSSVRSLRLSLPPATEGCAGAGMRARLEVAGRAVGQALRQEFLHVLCGNALRRLAACERWARRKHLARAKDVLALGRVVIAPTSP